MRVEGKIVLADISGFLKDIESTLTAYRIARWVALILAVIFIGYFILALVLFSFPPKGQANMIGIIGLACLTVTLWKRRQFHAVIKAAVLGDKNELEVAYELKPNSIRRHADGKVASLSFSEVKRVERGERGLYIYSKENGLFVVPLSFFDSTDERNRFLGRVRGDIA